MKPTKKIHGIYISIIAIITAVSAYFNLTFKQEIKTVQNKLNGYVMLDSSYADANSVTEVYNVYSVEDTTVTKQEFFKVTRNIEQMQRDLTRIRLYKLNNIGK